VVSRLLASVGNNSSNPRQFSNAILQTFEFPEDQKPVGYFRGFGEHYYPSSKPTISLETQYVFILASKLSSRDISNRDETTEPLEGFFVWSKDSIYELVPKVRIGLRMPCSF
jgi:hypothetical protein